MRYDIDAIAKYAWIALLVVIIAAVVLIVLLPAEIRSACTGFQYFVFLSQKTDEDMYQIELLNGPRDVSISGMSVNGIEMAAAADVAAGEKFILTSSLDPTAQKIGEAFAYKVYVRYDINGGIKDNADAATCTGRIQ